MTTPKRPTLQVDDEVLRMVQYGDPGTGKTSNAASMTSLGTVIYLDTEQGLKPKALERVGVDITKIEPYRSLDYSELTELLWDVKGRVADGEKIAGIVWDTITASVPAYLADVTREEARKAEARGEKRATYTAHQNDWGDVVAQHRELFRLMCSIPIHLVVSAHTRRSTDEDGNVRVGPASSPALQSDLFAYTDLVMMTKTTEVAGTLVYAAQTKPIGRFDAKDRYGVLPTNMADPTFTRIRQYAMGELTDESDQVQINARKLTQSTTNTTKAKESK